MKCSDARLLISRSLDETLPEYERSMLGRHLPACAPCVRYQTDLMAGSALLQSRLAQPSANFEWKVQLKIQQALREAAAQQVAAEAGGTRRFWVPLGSSALLAAAAVLVAGGLWIHGRSASPAGVLDPTAASVTDSGAQTAAVTTPRAAPQQPAPASHVAARESQVPVSVAPSPGMGPDVAPGFAHLVNTGQGLVPTRDEQGWSDPFLDPQTLTSRRQLAARYEQRRQDLAMAQREMEEIRRLLQQDVPSLAPSDSSPATAAQR